MNGDSIEFDLSRRNEALARENRILKDRLNEIEEVLILNYKLFEFLLKIKY